MGKKFLDLIDVPNPCEKSWDEMIGNEQVRHCLHCDNNIYNLSEMSGKEAQKLFVQNKGRVCVRLTRDADGKVKTNDRRSYQITRKTKFAASVLSITLALTTIPFAQTTITNNNNEVQEKVKQQKNLLTLKITDSKKGVIANARVRIVNLETKEEKTARSDENGELQFVIGKFGRYEIIVDGIAEFKELKRVVELKEENRIITLELDDEQPIIGTTANVLGTSISQSDIESLPLNGSNSTKQQKNKTSRISFTIIDTNGAIIPDAQVKLTKYKTNQEFIVNTNDKGIAYFSLLPRGRYKIEASANNFRTAKISIFVKENIEPNVEIYLEVGIFTGIISINWYEVPILNSIVQEDFDVVKNYVSQGKNVNIKDKFRGNTTMLHVAAESGNFEMIKLLVDAGAKVNAKDKMGRTPIMMIDLDEEDSLEIVKFFISKAANVNLQNKDEDGETLLMTACDDDSSELVKMLLEAGANPNLKDEDGETAMMKTSSEEIKNLLKKYGAKQ